MLDHSLPQRRVAVSIVAPCYNEEACLPEFLRRAMAAAEAAVGVSYEIVLVDDGSRDGTWDLIETFANRYPEVTGVRLLRNHGHQLAATAGLRVARGERVMLIDADLQDQPEHLSAMMDVMDAERAEVVYGQRRQRAGETAFKLATAAGFYLVLSKVAGVRIPRNTGDFRLMRRRTVDVLCSMPERRRFLRGMVAWIGGKQVAFPYDRDARFAGTTNYPLKKMLRLAADALTAFSVAPLQLATYLGFASAGLAGLIGLYSVAAWVLGATVAGWTSLLGVWAFFSAVQLIVLGIMGSYIGRLAEDIRQRPMVLVDRVICGGIEEPIHPDVHRVNPHNRIHGGVL